MHFPETKELYNVEENYPEQMDNCRLNSSNPESFFECMNKSSSKTLFLQSFQLSMKTAVQESKQSIWSSSDTTFASNNQLLDSVSVQWNSLKENSPESVTEDHEEVTVDHEEVILASDCKFGPVTETDNVPNYSDNITGFRVETPSSIHTCSEYRCCSDVLSCCDVLNSSDDLSCSGGAANSNSWDLNDQHHVQNGQLSVRHRNSGLFSVDLCSLVGQRYLQFKNTCSYFNPDDELSYDLYCQWPMIEDTTRWLRPRPEPYPVTFKKEGESLSFTHTYKFSRAEQMEFAQKVGHSLNRRSRKLQRQMKQCFVPLARLPVGSLIKYRSCQPVVCVAPLSKSVIKRWVKNERVVNSSNKVSLKHHKKSGRHVATFSGCPTVPLTRCDFKCAKISKLFEGQSSWRVPLSCLNQSAEAFSVKCSSLAVRSRSFGGSNFSENSFLLHRKFLRRPTVLLEKISSAFNRIKLPNSVSPRACTSGNHRKNQSHCLRMNQTTRNSSAGNCVVLLKDLGEKYMKKENPTSAIVGQKRRMKQMKIDQCFVSLTDCSGKNSVPVANTRCVALKRRRHSNPEWLCVKENHSALTKSLANVKSVRSNNNCVVLKQNRGNAV